MFFKFLFLFLILSSSNSQSNRSNFACHYEEISAEVSTEVPTEATTEFFVQTLTELAPDVCQCSNVALGNVRSSEERILDGQFAPPNSLSYLGSLFQRKLKQFRRPLPPPYDYHHFSHSHFCTLILINDRYFLTAAHCLTSALGNIRNCSERHLHCEFRCGVGYQNLVQMYTNSSFHSVVAGYNIHPAYNHSDILSGNDIALIRAETPFLIGNSTGISLACLLFQEIHEDADFSAIIAGYGEFETREEPVSQDQLRRGRQINEPIDIREDASIVLRFTTTVRIRRTDSDPPENRTIKTRVADSTICPGDSGGPLLYHDGNKTYVIGINSFAIPPIVRHFYTGQFLKLICANSTDNFHIPIWAYRDYIQQFVGDEICVNNFTFDRSDIGNRPANLINRSTQTLIGASIFPMVTLVIVGALILFYLKRFSKINHRIV